MRHQQRTSVLVPRRILLSALAAAAVLVAPVASAGAKQHNDKPPDGGSNGGKKCDKPKRVGFKVNGTFDSHVDPDLTVTVTRANKHARRWLEDNPPVFDVSSARMIKFIDVTDTGDGTAGFEDALTTDRVKINAMLKKPKRSCDGDLELRVKKVKVKRPSA